MSIRQLRKRVKEYYGLKSLPRWSLKTKPQRPENVSSLKGKDRGRWTKSNQRFMRPRPKIKVDSLGKQFEAFEQFLGGHL